MNRTKTEGRERRNNLVCLYYHTSALTTMKTKNVATKKYELFKTITWSNHTRAVTAA